MLALSDSHKSQCRHWMTLLYIIQAVNNSSISVTNCSFLPRYLHRLGWDSCFKYVRIWWPYLVSRGARAASSISARTWDNGTFLIFFVQVIPQSHDVMWSTKHAFTMQRTVECWVWSVVRRQRQPQARIPNAFSTTRRARESL